jgi:hypothetical protein
MLLFEPTTLVWLSAASKKGSALMAVMRKMLAVAVHLTPNAHVMRNEVKEALVPSERSKSGGETEPALLKEDGGSRAGSNTGSR